MTSARTSLLKRIWIRFALGKRKDWFENYKVREAIFELCYWISCTTREKEYVFAVNGFILVDFLETIVGAGRLKLPVTFLIEEFNHQLYADLCKQVEQGLVCGRDWMLKVKGNEMVVELTSE